ncbi:MAG: hypothetical protein EXR92_06050 [Gemmatimonadetes bacterium]|nr:hypothetical protein [Gemmatimonadota bacterium]
MRRRDFFKASTAGISLTVLQGCEKKEEEQFIVQVPLRPGVLQGESVWRPGVCRQCSAACGIQVRVVDGNAKKIEGLPDNPINQGGVCALGQSLLQELYNPDRILVPQRRTGNRGEGSFEPTTWEDALAEVVAAIGSAPVEGVAFVGADRRGLTGALFRRLAAALGAPPPTFVEAPELEVERQAALISLGIDDIPYFDVRRSDYVLSIGAPIVDRWRSPVHYTRALAEMRRGRPRRRGRFVHAEARMSLTAANADEWLPVRPGTEGVLARALAGVLLSEGGVAVAARERYSRLFPDDPPSLGEAASVCDLNPERIRRVALELGAAENRMVVSGGSAAAHSNGLFNVVAALGLNVLLDNLGKSGGVFAPARFDLASGIEPPEGGQTSMAELAARLRGEATPPVQLLFVAETDLLHALPASWGVADALASLEKVIVMSSFTDDTALHADLLLPLSTELERFDAVEPAASIGVSVLGLSRPAIDALGEGRHPGDVLLSVAAALGEPVAGQFPWASFEALVRQRIQQEQDRLPGGPGASAAAYYFEALARGGIFEDGAPQLGPPGPAGPAPAATEARFDGSAEDFPFQLIPYESLKIGDGRGANRPWLQELPDPLSTVMWNGWAELSPTDAEQLGVGEGDRIRVESPAGSIEVLALIDPAVRPGVIGMPMGHGHRAYGRYAQGRGANPLDLVGRLQVDGTLAPAWAASRIRIQRLGSGSLARFGRSYTERGADERIPVAWAPMSTGEEVPA